MSLLLDIISWFAIVIGSFFVISGAVGLIRFPDFYSRLHAASMTDTLGIALILGGLALQAGWSLVLVKLIFIVVLVFITSPTASHALAKAGAYDDLRPWKPGEAAYMGWRTQSVAGPGRRLSNDGSERE